jgi:SRSO17 transposase
MTRVADRFVRAEPRATAGQFVEGLLSNAERKTCWSLAERAGHGDPQAMQRLLRTAVWDPDAVRDDLREWLIEQLGHPDAVLVTDETGFLKKGVCSVGVQRQCTGTAGRVENSQIGVFLAYVTPAGRAMIEQCSKPVDERREASQGHCVLGLLLITAVIRSCGRRLARRVARAMLVSPLAW